jgi:Flp pilus assembly protein TadG
MSSILRRPRRYSRQQRKGIGLVWAMLVILALCAIASLAVDYGRVQLVKAQLRSAADAAALAAGDVMQSDPAAARTAAILIAQANKSENKPVALDGTQDVEFGIWDSANRVFSPVNGANVATANAVRITARRTSARGNAIDLPFAKLIGMNTCDVSASAIASANTADFNVVGLDSVSLSGGSVTGSQISKANVASNGDISLSGSATITGDAHPGKGKSLKHSGSSKVTGSTAPLVDPLLYPNGDPKDCKSNNRNLAVPSFALKNGAFGLSGSQSVTLVPGSYCFTSFNMSGSTKLVLTGPTIIYCSGKFTLSGSVVNNYGNNPQSFRIVLFPDNGVAPGKVDLSGSTGLYANVYAPQSPINISGSGHLYGSLVGKSITQSGSASIHGSATTRSGSVALVK